MATHGTVLLTSDSESGEILLQTPHDGVYADLEQLIKSLPRKIAVWKNWRVRTLVDVFIKDGRQPTMKHIQDWERSDSTCKPCLIELASWIVAARPMLYRVMPKPFQKDYLAAYDRKRSLHYNVRIVEGSVIQVRPKVLKASPTVSVNLIEEIHKIHLRMAISRWKRQNEMR